MLVPLTNQLAQDDVLPVQLARSRWRPTAAQRRQMRREGSHFEKVRRVESWYATQLRKVARHVGDLVRQFGVDNFHDIHEVLAKYSLSLEPWARAVAGRLISEVSRRDASAWFKTSHDLGVALREEIESAPLGDVARRLLEEQVELITSLPLEAARRVQEQALQAATSGGRHDALQRSIMDTGRVTASRATLIARTEVAKAQSVITRARALHVGSDSYMWMTAHDRAVRPAHKRLSGTVQRWDMPPIAEEGGDRHHPGEFPNCRCWADPILPEKIL